MNIGKFNKSITIVKKEVYVNDRGFKEEEYVDVKNTRASIVEMNSREIITAEKLNIINAKKVVIRATKNISESHFIKYKNEIYKIKSMNLINDERYIEILIENIKDSM